MGDNEAGKLKEDRKAVWKGKARQEEEGSNTTITSDDEALAQRQKAINVDMGQDNQVVEADIDDQVIEADMSSLVCPPYKFSKPEGGTGPHLRMEPSQKKILPDTNSPPHALDTIPNPLNLPLDALAALTCTVLGVDMV